MCICKTNIHLFYKYNRKIIYAYFTYIYISMYTYIYMYDWTQYMYCVRFLFNNQTAYGDKSHPSHVPIERKAVPVRSLRP